MTAQNKKTEIKIDLENLFDWICVQIGFDKEGKEIQKAIKLFNQQFILEELAGQKEEIVGKLFKSNIIFGEREGDAFKEININDIIKLLT